MQHIEKYACFYFPEELNISKALEVSFDLSSHVYYLEKYAVIVEYGRSFKLFSEQEFFIKAKNLFNFLQRDYRIGAAQNALFSFIQAKYNEKDIGSCPLEALIDLCDPKQKNLNAIREIKKMIQSLKKMQIRTLRDYGQLPKNQIPTRFGKLGELLKFRVAGSHLIGFDRAEIPYKFFAVEEMPSCYNGALAQIVSTIERLLENKIFPALQKIEAKLEELRISFILEKNSLYPEGIRHFDIKYVTPQFRAEDCINIIWTCLDVELQKKPISFSTPILQVEVQATQWLFDVDSQDTMFNEESKKDERHHALLTRQKLRYGEENIFSVELTHDWRPEKSWKKHLDLKKAPKKFVDVDDLPERLISGYSQNIKKYPAYISTDRTRITSGKWSKLIKFEEPMNEVIMSHWDEDQEGNMNDACVRTYIRLHLEGDTIVDGFEDENGKFFIHGYSG